MAKKTYTVTDKEGKTRTVTVNPNRRSTITGKGAVVYKTKRSQVNGRTLIEGKNKDVIRLEAREKEAGIRAIEQRREAEAKKKAEVQLKAQREKEVKELQATQIKKQYDTVQGFNPVTDGGQALGTQERNVIGRIETQQAPRITPQAKKTTTWVERYRENQERSGSFNTVSKAETTTSQNLLNKALKEDAKRTQSGSFKAVGLTVASGGASILEVVKGALVNDEELVKSSGTTFKTVLFPEVDKGTVYQRSGATITGFVSQELLASGVGKGIVKATTWAKATFGTRNIVTKSTGVGETRSFLNSAFEDVSTGSFTQRRAVITPIEEAKKSNVVLQEITTASGTAPRKDGVFKAFTFDEGARWDVIQVREKKGGVKNIITGIKPERTIAFYPEQVSITKSTISSFDLTLKPVGTKAKVNTLGLSLPKTDYTLRIIETTEKGSTKLSTATTKTKKLDITGVREIGKETETFTINEGGLVANIQLESPTFTRNPTTYYLQETTLGAGKKQTVNFLENVVVKTPEERLSEGGLSNALESIGKQKTKVSPAKSTSQVAKLPVTLQAGTKPLSIKIPNFKTGGLPSITSTTAFTPDRRTKQPQTQAPVLIPTQDVKVEMGRAIRIKEETTLQPTQYRLTETGITEKQATSRKTAQQNVIVPIVTTTQPQVIPPITSINTPSLNTPRKPTPFKLPKIPILPSFKGGATRSNPVNQFSALVKVRGKWLNIGKGLSKTQAVNLSKSFVTRRSSASFKILDRSGKAVTNIGLGNMFRRSKKDKGVFVEKEKFRLDFPTEISEVTFSPKQRRRKKRGRKK